MTVSEQFEKLKEKMCSEYCKYPTMEIPEGKDEDWLIEDDDSPCNTCPLNKL